jgi:2-polyprenyl-6-methoxyphenol hydroxylase-like FAD-dependent oxidoreductase
MTTRQPQTSSTAVIIGGSMAGLLAARVLAETFAHVMVLDRDELPDAAVARKGVPQARHAHALLGRGLVALEGLFPGIGQELQERGAQRGHGRFYSGGGYHRINPRGAGGLFVSRPCLEHVVRERVRQLPQVTFLQGCAVEGLLASDDRQRVTGVRYTHGARGARGAPGAGEQECAAALVVDASGRGSRLPAWLEALGYAPPETEVVEVHMGYSTRFYRRAATDLNGDLMINIAPTPDNRRACGMMAQEGDRWIVTLAGYHGDHPPTDEQGYLEFARRLPVPDVYTLIASATPLTDPVPYRFRSNQWRHYERLQRFPSGLLAIGDAIASFTPIYGQGMTVAAMEAEALRAALAGSPERLAARYFPAAARVVAMAWTITVGNDATLLRDPGLRNPTPAPVRWYLGKVQVAARTDPRVSAAFQRVGQLFDPAPTLLHPAIAWRVLRAGLPLLRRPVTPLEVTPAVEARGSSGGD